MRKTLAAMLSLAIALNSLLPLVHPAIAQAESTVLAQEGTAGPPAAPTSVTSNGFDKSLAATLVVTSTADSGAGTLRWAVQTAVSGDVVGFDTSVFSPTNPATITLTSGPLPAITQTNVTIDASDAGVVLDGSALVTGDGLTLSSDSNVVRGLQVLYFPSNGIAIGANYNVVGGTTAAERNVISGNGLRGVLLSGSSTVSNTVSGNYIGTDVAGALAIPNGGNGVEISGGSSHNLIGGDGPGEGNLISGNSGSGVDVHGTGTTHNTVSGNYIGTDATGTVAMPNQADGIAIHGGASNNTIGGANGSPGGACSGGCNLISGNSFGGVSIDGSSTMSNTVSGSYIGTDATGTATIPNADGGIYISAHYSTIGGDSNGERNLISGNGGPGICFYGVAYDNVVVGNYIGTDATGTVAIPNQDNGVKISGGSSLNVIGGDSPGEGNLISGNSGHGVDIRGTGTTSNTVNGNYIGTNASGTDAISNTGNGVYLRDEASYNSIGGDTPGEGNLISGNTSDGVKIEGHGSVSNTVSGNHIGTDVGGLTALGNGANGISIRSDASYNLIGGDSPGEGNLISGNGNNGVGVSGYGSVNNTISGNYIGTDVNGTSVLGNSNNGVSIENWASHNTIGGNNASPGSACSGDCNLISGNGNNGVGVSGYGSVNNTISGNYIGTDVNGISALGNAIGIQIRDDASDTIVGGDTPGERNLISGNSGEGIIIIGANNTIIGNYIGTDASGTAAIPNQTAGLWIFGGAHDNVIGGTNATPGGDCSGECNLISGNVQRGIGLDGPGSTRYNTIQGNYIGTDVSGTSAIDNGYSGVGVTNGTNHTTISDNLISRNTGDGVTIEDGGTMCNTITQNAIHANEGKGISLSGGGNWELASPVISNLDLATGMVSGTACASCTIEVFSDDDDEGRVYEGTTTADGGGAWSFSKGSALTGPHVTATATDAQGNTSEFSAVPYMRVQRSYDWVNGQVPQFSAQIDVALYDSGGAIKGTSTVSSDEWGRFSTSFDDGFGGSLDIVSGDVVSMSIEGGLVITTEVVALSGSVDVVSDTISGAIPGGAAGQKVWAEVTDLPDGPGEFESTVQAGGTYTVPLAGFDVLDGHRLQLWYRNGQGNYIGIARNWLRIEARTQSSDVWGHTTPGATVQITVTRGGDIKGTAVTVADGEGNYQTQVYSGTQPVSVVSGDTILATADDRSTSMVLEDLTGVLDFYADAVCGVAPPQTEVYVDVWGESGGWYDVDASGHYCVDLGFDLQPGHSGEVSYFDDKGHRPRASLTSGERHVMMLTLGEPLIHTVAPFSYSDYKVEVEAGQNLLVELVPQDGIAQIHLYGRYGEWSSRAQYDVQTSRLTPSGGYELLVSPSRQGAYYFSVFGWDLTGPQGTYTIVARTVPGRYLSDVQPRVVGNSGESTLTVRGFGLGEGVTVELRRAGLPTLGAGSVIKLSSTESAARFDLTGAAPGLYDAVAVWDGGGEETLIGAFEIHDGGVGPQLDAWLEAPEFVRPDRTFTLWVNYANTGDADLVAPLFVVSSPDGVPMRLSGGEPFEDRPVQVRGSSPDGYAGLLPPGMSGRVPVYFHVPAGTAGHEMLEFDLSVVVSDTLPIDWEEVEADIRPPDVDSEVWDVVWPAVTSQIGATWGDYRQALDDNASYLSTLDRPVHSTQELFRFEVRKAMGMSPRSVLASQIDTYTPAPGMEFRMGRVFPGSLEGRFYLGPLGRGWSHSYDIFLEEQSGGDVLVHWPGGFTRLFRSNGDGTYTPLPGDHGALARAGGGFELTEKDGTVYRFQADLLLDYVEDTNGNRVTAVYDGNDRLIELQHTSGISLGLEYNAHGRVSRLTDHVGRETIYGYDGTGEYLLIVTAPGGRTTTYSYTLPSGQPADHALLSITYADGTHQYYVYDSHGRLSEEYRDGGAEHLTYTYDTDGQIHVTNGDGATSVLSPDEYGRAAKVRDGLGSEMGQVFDTSFNLSQLVDPSGQPYWFEYDLLGNVIAAEDPLGNRIKLSYDTRFSTIASLEDARSNRTTFAYDTSGNLTTLTYPDATIEQFTYDTTGNPLTFEARSGDTITYSYDAQGQLLSKGYPDGSWVAYTYDAAGNMITASDPSGTITMTYEADTDYLVSITYPSGYCFTFSYNDAGQRTQRVDQDGHELNYEHDGVGRLYRLHDEHGTTLITYTYDAVGRLSQESKGNGTYTVYGYDEAGQVLTITHHAPDDSVQSFFHYTYDANGNRASMTTLEGTTTYEYDLIGQLTGVTYPDSRHVTYAYDAAGNRTTVTDDGTATAYTTNEMNQYTDVGGASYTYDDNGNMTTKTDAGGTTTYEYDYEDRLIRVTTPASGTWEYTYDALGNRVAVGHDGAVTRYVHDPIGLVDLVAEYDGGGTLVAQYVHGLGLAARIDAAGDAAYYGFDGSGHTRQVTDDAGDVANTYDYTPFGTPLQTDETIPNPFRYVGRFGVMEEGNGLTFMRARYYGPELGRFTSADPLGIGGGANLYSYVDNNPVTFSDPLGLDTLEAFLKDTSTYASVCATACAIVGAEPAALVFAGIAVGAEGARIVLYSENPTADTAKVIGNMVLCHAIGIRFGKGYDQLIEAAELLLGALIDRAGEWYIDSISSPDFHPGTLRYLDTVFSENITSDDPNEKVGPAGTGQWYSVDRDDELHYVVYFENKAEAGAPAQEVFITDVLDPDLDWSTFRLTEVAWGDHVVAVPGNSGDFSTQQMVADYRVGVGTSWWVNIEVETDYTSGQVEWTFRTLDPQTDDLPLDPLAGFLPPNDETHRGEGYVAFTIRPRADCADGTILTNQANIVFDTNEPIVTNQVTNTIDAAPPGVTSTSPTDGAKGVALEAPIVIVFTEPISPGSLALVMTPTTGMATAWNAAGTIVTATHAAFDEETVYTATVTANDLLGKPLDEPFSWSFTTSTGTHLIYLPVVIRRYQSTTLAGGHARVHSSGGNWKTWITEQERRQQQVSGVRTQSVAFSLRQSYADLFQHPKPIPPPVLVFHHLNHIGELLPVLDREWHQCCKHLVRCLGVDQIEG